MDRYYDICETEKKHLRLHNFKQTKSIVIVTHTHNEKKNRRNYSQKFEYTN